MITKDDITKYINNPELTSEANIDDLKKIVEIYPYCEILKWIYLRFLYTNNDITFDEELMKYGMHISNRKVFYDYMTYEPQKETEQTISTEKLINIAQVNYFEIKNNPEQQHSLKELAEKLKQARLEKQKKENDKGEILTEINKAEITTTSLKLEIKNTDTKEAKTKTEVKTDITDEEKVQKLIKEKKYTDALAILRSINLNNPKKSVYFALQIKYLETIINNNNKIS